MAKATKEDCVLTDRATIQRFCGLNYDQHSMDFMGIKVWEEGHMPENGEELPISVEQWMRNKTEALKK